MVKNLLFRVLNDAIVASIYLACLNVRNCEKKISGFNTRDIVLLLVKFNENLKIVFFLAFQNIPSR